MDPVHSAIRLACAVLAVTASTLSTYAADALGDDDPCGDGVTAFVSNGGGQCRATSGEDRAQLLKKLAKGSAMRAGDEIECAAGAKVTITFCASREDMVITGGAGSRYIVPNVPNKERQEEQQNLAPAIRRAQEESPKQQEHELERVAAEHEEHEEHPPLPTCERTLATIAVVEPEEKWWTQYDLESPKTLIKLYAQKSGCFTIVERGEGLASAQQERAVAGSNQNHGQKPPADFVLVPDIARKSEGSGRLGGFLGSMGSVAGVAGPRRTAAVVLTLTDVRSAEQVALESGTAKKTDLGWSRNGSGRFFGGFGAAGASGYANTEMGQLVALAYADAFKKLIEEVKEIEPKDEGR